MGQKIHPIGFRLAVNRDWSSQWFARKSEYSANISKDYQMRRHITEKYSQAMIAKIEIGRKDKIRIRIFCARPGMIIGKKGEDIERLRASLRKISGMQDVTIDIRELRQAETNASLVAQNIASQLEKRVMFRRAMRRAMQNAKRVGVKGIKIMCKGRLNGAEIARFERYHDGRVPLHTLRAHIDYGLTEARTSMGVIGVKVWIFKGETPARAKVRRDVDELLASTKSVAHLDASAEKSPDPTEGAGQPAPAVPDAPAESGARRARAPGGRGKAPPRHGGGDWDDSQNEVLDEDDFDDLSDLAENDDAAA